MGPLDLRRGGATFVLAAIAGLSAIESQATEFRQITFETLVYDNGVGSPDWSPDGSTLAATGWIVDSFYPYEIHLWVRLVPVEGSGWPQIPNQNLPGSWHGPLNMDPSWSPSGDRIVFSAGNSSLWIVGVAESLLTPLGVGGSEPAWSPDGHSIAYGDWTGIWVVPSAGGSEIRLTTGPDRGPAWSRDGQWIAFSSTRDGRSDLWIVAAQGGQPHRLTDDAAVDSHPSWSPDGELIAFASDRSGNNDLWVARVSSGALSQVTFDPASDVHPAWSPDGTRIAFASDRSGCANIWIASELRTVHIEPTTWSALKKLFR